VDLGTVLLVILILALVGALPTWGYSRGWGYGPSGLVGLFILVLLIWLIVGGVSRAQSQVLPGPPSWDQQLDCPRI
jgi:hypothetical protein